MACRTNQLGSIVSTSRETLNEGKVSFPRSQTYPLKGEALLGSATLGKRFFKKREWELKLGYRPPHRQTPSPESPFDRWVPSGWVPATWVAAAAEPPRIESYGRIEAADRMTGSAPQRPPQRPLQ